MAPEEVLLSRNDVSNDNGGSEGEDDVLVVRVQDQARVHFAYSGETPSAMPQEGECLPWKPMTAPSSSSFSIVGILKLFKK